jgi:transposase
MENTNNAFSEAFKRQVISEVLSGRLTKEQARKQYRIKGKSAVLNWIRKFDLSNPVYMPDKPSDTKELQAKIKKLEQELEDAQFKAEAYSTMIDIAERELKISIRKKSNTKQSKK